tara:strand:+ start:2596 stop:2847 length:252 start_codon:yes stop_codon:yes gene_type:complete
MITDYNNLKKQIIYRLSHSGTKESDIVYKRLIIDRIDKFRINDLKLILHLIEDYSDSEILLILSNKFNYDPKYKIIIEKILSN